MGRFFPRANPGEVDIRGSRSFILFFICLWLVLWFVIVGLVVSCARLYPAARLPWPVCWLSFWGEKRGGGLIRPALCRLAAEVDPLSPIGGTSLADRSCMVARDTLYAGWSPVRANGEGTGWPLHLARIVAPRVRKKITTAPSSGV